MGQEYSIDCRSESQLNHAKQGKSKDKAKGGTKVAVSQQGNSREVLVHTECGDIQSTDITTICSCWEDLRLHFETPDIRESE